jgi:hypothetical protein
MREWGADWDGIFFLQRLNVSLRFCFDVVHYIPPRVYCRSGDFCRASLPSFQHWPGVWEDLLPLAFFLALRRNFHLHKRLDAKISVIWVLPLYMCVISLFSLHFSLDEGKLGGLLLKDERKMGRLL